jgi:Lecithin:cholesterol acyltransferase
VPICYLVPGVGGSTLGRAPSGASPLWVDYTQILLGQIGQLRLAPDGVSPGGADGRQCYAGGPLEDYYALAAALLDQQLRPHGYRVSPVGYDWRLALSIYAEQLADLIDAEVSQSEPCSIVAHSMGGMVARRAWGALVARGRQGKVRRLVTLGTPHQGSYSVAALWAGESESLGQLALLAAIGTLAQISLGPLATPAVHSIGQLIELSQSWPSLYALLPLLGSPDQIDDPLRPGLYSWPWLGSAGVSQHWLDLAGTTWAIEMLAGATYPPADVLTTVAGDGLPTPDRLVSPASLGYPSAYGRTTSGDGSVTVASALLPQSAQVVVRVAHTDLPAVLAASGLLAELVLATRLPLAPPPPTQQVPEITAQQRYGPPLAGPLATLALGASAMHDC